MEMIFGNGEPVGRRPSAVGDLTIIIIDAKPRKTPIYCDIERQAVSTMKPFAGLTLLFTVVS